MASRPLFIRHTSISVVTNRGLLLPIDYVFRCFFALQWRNSSARNLPVCDALHAAISPGSVQHRHISLLGINPSLW